MASTWHKKMPAPKFGCDDNALNDNFQPKLNFRLRRDRVATNRHRSEIEVPSTSLNSKEIVITANVTS